MPSDSLPPEPVARAVEVIRRGRHNPESVAALVTTDPDPRVRTAALGVVAAAGGPAAGAAIATALADPDAGVRRRAAEHAATAPVADVALVVLLEDRDSTVVEAAAWALGERMRPGTVPALARCATEHADPLAREAAVAALGAIGDPAGLPAILAACEDKAAVRRRAVLALAPFDGPEVDVALARARDDRDWQVRQAAEDLMDRYAPE